MGWKLRVLAIIAVLAAGAIGFGPAEVGVAHAGCDADVKLDHSTADQARKKMEAAGYRQITELKKGCDNYWHAKAMKGATAVRIVLTPQGEVLTEGD